jgi:F-type H+-transporting ATPase subunit delta
MKISPFIYAKALHAVSTSKPPHERSLILKELAIILKENGDERSIEKIAHEFEKLAPETIQKKYFITGATEDDIATVKKHLGKNANILKSTIDATLIGGAIIQTNDTIIDGSIRRRIEKLTETIA